MVAEVEEEEEVAEVVEEVQTTHRQTAEQSLLCAGASYCDRARVFGVVVLL